MLKRISPLLLSLIMASNLSAQQADSTEETAEEEAPVLQGDLSTGTPATDGPQIGQPYTKEEIGDWQLRCIRTQNAEDDPCQLYQLLKDGSGNAVSEVSVFRVLEGGEVVAGATIIVPLETLLTAQLTMAVDGDDAKRYPFAFCNTVGCYARIGMSQADVDAFKRGAKAQVQIRPFAAPDQTVTVEMSLSGFTAGFDKVSAIQRN